MLAGADAVNKKVRTQSPRGQVISFSEAVRNVESPLRRQSSARIAIKGNKKILFIDAADVLAVEARGNYVAVHLKLSSYMLRGSISKIAEKLRAFGFVRIHRSFIVNSAFAEDLQPLPTGEYILRIEGGKEYVVSRTYKNNLQFLASSWIGSIALGDR